MNRQLGGKQANGSADRFLRVDLPPVFHLDTTSDKAVERWLTVADPLNREWFVRTNDGSFIASGYGGDPITIRATKLLGGGKIEAVDDLGGQVSYRIRPKRVLEFEPLNTARAKGKDSVTTPTGRIIDLYDPDPQMICADDIATTLASTFRQVPKYSESYSTAQSALLATEIICGPLERADLALTVLHSRSHEAYCFGSANLIKSGSEIGNARREAAITLSIKSAIEEAFKIKSVRQLPHEEARLVEQAHAIAVAMESQRLTPGAFELARQDLDLGADDTQLTPMIPRPMEPREAELKFLRLHGRLVG